MQAGKQASRDDGWMQAVVAGDVMPKKRKRGVFSNWSCIMNLLVERSWALGQSSLLDPALPPLIIVTFFYRKYNKDQ